MKKKILLMLLVLSACTLTQGEFLTRLIGTYRLTEAGVVFLTREFGTTDNLTISSRVSINAAGDIMLEDGTGAGTLFLKFNTFRKNDKAGIFEISGTGTYTAVRCLDRRLVATTNQQITSPDTVNVAFGVPIATKE